jgi:hypothetical protein
VSSRLRTGTLALLAIGLAATLTGCIRDPYEGGIDPVPPPPTGSPSATQPAGIPGTIFYAVGAPAVPEIRKVTAGVVSSVLKLPAGVERFRISPDGTKVAYQLDRNLLIGPVDGSSTVQIEDLSTGSDFDWSPDSTQLVYTSWSAYEVFVKVVNADGSGQHGLGKGMYPVWSPDGGWIAFVVLATGMNQLTLVHPDGSGSHTVAVALGPGQAIWDVNSVSPGGSEVFIAPDCPLCNNRLLARDFKGSLVVDTTTGAVHALAATGGTAEMVFWLKDGSTLVRIVTAPAPPAGGWPTYDVELRAPDGTVKARAAEPSNIHGPLFLYTP